MSGPPTFAAEAPRPARPSPEDEDLAWLLSRPEGRRVLRRLLGRTGLFAASFSPDPLTLAYREGGRAVGLALVAMIGAAAPERLAELLVETPAA